MAAKVQKARSLVALNRQIDEINTKIENANCVGLERGKLFDLLRGVLMYRNAATTGHRIKKYYFNDAAVEAKKCLELVNAIVN